MMNTKYLDKNNKIPENFDDFVIFIKQELQKKREFMKIFLGFNGAIIFEINKDSTFKILY